MLDLIAFVVCLLAWSALPRGEGRKYPSGEWRSRPSARPHLGPKAASVTRKKLKKRINKLVLLLEEAKAVTVDLQRASAELSEHRQPAPCPCTAAAEDDVVTPPPATAEPEPSRGALAVNSAAPQPPLEQVVSASDCVAVPAAAPATNTSRESTQHQEATCEFDGRSNPLEFLDDLEYHFDLCGVPDDAQLGMALRCLRGSARDWANTERRDGCLRTYEDFRDAIRDEFWSDTRDRLARFELQQSQWDADTGLSMAEWCVSIQRRARHLDPPLSDAETARLLTRHFPGPVRMGLIVLTSQRRTVKAIRKYLRELDDDEKWEAARRPPPPPRPRDQPKSAAAAGPKVDVDAEAASATPAKRVRSNRRARAARARARYEESGAQKPHPSAPLVPDTTGAAPWGGPQCW